MRIPIGATRPLGWAMLLAAAGLVGCDGYLVVEESSSSESESPGAHEHREETTVAVPGGTSEGSDPAPDDGADQPVACDEAVADVPTRLMTSSELDAALADLFPKIELGGVEPGTDKRVGPFVLNARETVAQSHIRGFRKMAEEIATRISGQVDKLLDCESRSAETESQCAHAFIEEFGHRAFRRPLSEEKRSRLIGLYEAGREADSHAEGIRWVVEAVLQAPSFMYLHRRVGETGETERLGDYEIAQRMASTLTRSLPDRSLMEAAEEGRLTDTEVRESHARRLLGGERSTETLVRMVTQWLGIDRLEPSDLGGIEEADRLAESMRRETREVVERVLEENDGDWKELLTADSTYVDRRLADHYGVDLEEAEQVEEDLWRVELPHRAGVMTHAAFLTRKHGPIHRGLAIRSGLLCGSVPGPNNVDTDAIPTEPGESARSKSNKRLDNPDCSGCHRRMDPLGLPFESFGALGRYRVEDEHGNPVETNGEILGTGVIDGPVEDVPQLMDRLAGSQEVRDCVSKNLFVWVYGRTPNQDEGDQCRLDRIGAALESHDGNLEAALVELVTDAGFIKKRISGSQP